MVARRSIISSRRSGFVPPNAEVSGGAKSVAEANDFIAVRLTELFNGREVDDEC